MRVKNKVSQDALLDEHRSMDKDLSSDLSSDWPVNLPVKRCGTSITLNASAERMVGLGFRCWVRGVQTNDTRFFDVCNRQYIQAFGLKDGLVLSTKLGSWVNALDKISKRPIKIEKIVTPGFSYDEVVAISMIAACQHSECPALKACVYAITEAAEIDLPQLAAQDFADGLVDAGQILQINSIAQPLNHMATEPTHFPN